jgi:hypothetical protein
MPEGELDGYRLSSRKRVPATQPTADDAMPYLFRVTKSPDVGDLVDSIQAAESFARSNGPGRYRVDEHSADPLPGSKSTAKGWGTVIHQPNGRVALKPFFVGDNVLTEEI